MPDDRLPTREQIANLPKPETRSTCVLCWQEKSEALDNGVCEECRRGLGKRVTALVAENARLREAVDEAHRLIEGALAPGAIGRPVREFTRGEMADLEMALRCLTITS